MKTLSKALSGFILFLLLFITESGYAQSSLVPSYHPVYEWLYLQRVKGVLPDYDYESLPLNRSVLLNHLNSLAENDRINGKERRTLISFINEFDPSHLKTDEVHSLISDDSKLSFERFKKWIWNDGEKHLFSLSDSIGFLVLDHGFGRRPMYVKDGDMELSTAAAMLPHWRSYGSFKNQLGYHVELIRAQPIGRFLNFGFEDILDYDGFYSYNWKSLRGEDYNEYHYEAYVTGNFSIFQASIGRGNLKEGVGQSENLTFSRSSITFDWMKLKVGKKKIRYSLTHGTLSWPAINSTLPGDSTISTRNSPRRWVAYHKLIVQPSSRISFSAYEMINYSNRGAEIAYINPVNRYAFAEWELQDQDNGWAGAYLIVRPFNGAELYTELLIDDLGNTKDIISKKKFPETSRFARRYGLSTVVRPGIQFWGEYTRIDPFTYSHPRDLNAHTDKGIGLGSQIGPNADRSEAGIKFWGVGRSFLSLSYSYNRQGLDRFDANGDRIFLAGASPNDGRDVSNNRTNLFLDGDLHEWHRFLVQGSFEPKRGYIFKANVDVRRMIKGGQLNDLAIIWGEVVIGF